MKGWGLPVPCPLGSENPFCLQPPPQPVADPGLAAAWGTEGLLVCACRTPTPQPQPEPLSGAPLAARAWRSLLPWHRREMRLWGQGGRVQGGQLRDGGGLEHYSCRGPGPLWTAEGLLGPSQGQACGRAGHTPSLTAWLPISEALGTGLKAGKSPCQTQAVLSKCVLTLRPCNCRKVLSPTPCLTFKLLAGLDRQLTHSDPNEGWDGTLTSEDPSIPESPNFVQIH